MGRTAYLVAGASFARPGYQRPERDANAGKSSCRAQRGGFPGGEQGRRDSNPRPTVLESVRLWLNRAA
jgi:hypothetical protein